LFGAQHKQFRRADARLFRKDGLVQIGAELAVQDIAGLER